VDNALSITARTLYAPSEPLLNIVQCQTTQFGDAGEESLSERNHSPVIARGSPGDFEEFALDRCDGSFGDLNQIPQFIDSE
jgi:hypothetical protein